MKRFVILGAVVVLVLAGWTAAWFWGAGWITSQARALETADGVTTPRVTCGEFSVGGFPFRFDVTCGNATILSNDVTVVASGLQAAVEVYSPTHALVFAQSPVTVEDAFTGQKKRLDFESAEGSARLNGWRLARVSLVVEKPMWSDAVLEDILLARADHFEAHLVDLPSQDGATTALATLGVYSEVKVLSAPGYEVGAGHATLEATISGLPDDVRALGEPDQLQRWAAVGGIVDLVGFRGEDGARTFDVTGDVGLDAEGRTNGQVQIASKGIVELIQDQVPEQVRGLILGAPADDGSYAQTLSINAGVVFAGIVPAAVIPPLF